MSYNVISDHRGKLQMTFSPSNDMHSNILLSIHAKKGSFFVAPWFGSTLHEIKVLNDDSVSSVPARCIAALQWLIDIGRAKDFNITASAQGDHLDVKIVAIKTDGSAERYETFYRVF